MSNENTGNSVSRREFVKGAVASSLLGTGSMLGQAPAKRRYAVVGTGDRASGMWGSQLRERYSDVIQFVGLCDINP